MGHQSVILKSGDGGETWAKANAENDPEADGLEAAYLDILFLAHKTGFIVGSYGKLLHTPDGGESWTVAKQEDDPHFSHITPAPDGGLWLCGEYGTVWRSFDRGANWHPRMTPYDGTFFGVIPLARGGAVVFGLRGNIFRSEDGTEWERIESRTKALLHGGLALADGRLVLAAGAGQLLLSADRGRTFRLGSIAADKTATVTSLWQAADGGVLLTSEKACIGSSWPTLFFNPGSNGGFTKKHPRVHPNPGPAATFSLREKESRGATFGQPGLWVPGGFGVRCSAPLWIALESGRDFRTPQSWRDPRNTLSQGERAGERENAGNHHDRLPLLSRRNLNFGGGGMSEPVSRQGGGVGVGSRNGCLGPVPAGHGGVVRVCHADANRRQLREAAPAGTPVHRNVHETPGGNSVAPTA
ncbi:MAG: hypothetical protein CM1200mP34_0220 [Verrucomicrobiales bacterium]|nr:MAG: hypothetical protein CM1200mP34_0220 [Verrucomicrobiales bacterium]